MGLTCPVLMLLHIPCPTCGVTRALISLLKLDFSSYFRYNAMAIPLVIAVCLFLNTDILKSKKIAYGFGYMVILINTVYYLARLTVIY